MAFSAIIRRSARTAIPIASRVIGSQIQSPAAVKRAAFSTHFVRSTLCSSFRRFSSDVATSSDRKLLEVLQSEISVVEESEDYDKVLPFLLSLHSAYIVLDFSILWVFF